MLAKVANRVAKQQQIPGGVFNLADPALHAAILARIPVSGLWGIGKCWAQKLQALEITTALQLCESDPSQLRALFGVVMQRLTMSYAGFPVSTQRHWRLRNSRLSPPGPLVGQ
jgi:DNA polymerase V